VKVLLVEDDAALANGLQKALKREGFSVNHATTGKAAIAGVNDFNPDLVVLDLGLPDMDGMQVLTEMRKHSSKTRPVLILTARDTLTDKVSALDEGADDYLSKPFEMGELLARLRVLVRRISTITSSNIQLGPVALNLVNHQVTVDGKTINLARREYMLLKALMENTGRIHTREALENKLYDWGQEVVSNAIEAHVSNLRKKLPEGFIQTVRGVGYVINREQ
jgi:DNA-binding response OmpR family regulator